MSLYILSCIIVMMLAAMVVTKETEGDPRFIKSAPNKRGRSRVPHHPGESLSPKGNPSGRRPVALPGS